MKDREIIRTTCPRDCYDACGIAVVKRDGVVGKVLGDPDHAISRGALCGKCAIAYNGAWRDAGLRLSTPLRRTGRKGEGAFAPVSWDDALGEIAARFRSLIDAGRSKAIVHTHYTGTVGLIGGWFPIRLFNRMGATEVDPDTVCNKTGHVALETAFGNSLEGFDPRTVKDANTVLVWGANPSHSAPHQNKGWLKNAKAAGKTVIVVDPIAHDTAKAADIHLKLSPGSDAAVAFAMLHVMQKEGLVDRTFLDAHAQGWEELLPAIEATTPEAAAAASGVPADLIGQAALAYGRGPSLLWLGQGVQRQPTGGNVFRSLSALVAFSGNLGKPGAGFLYMNGPGGRGIDMAVLTAPHLAGGRTGLISHMDLAPTLEDPARAAAFVNWNNNPAASSPDQRRVRRALEREDLFHVALELFHTDTTAYADIVLPAASFLECDDLVLSYFDLTLSAQVKATPATGESLTNAEIFRRLAAAMGYGDPELFETDEALLARLLAATPYRGTFADLAGVGTVTLFPEPKVQFEGLRFNTPSGRIDLASERWVALGLPRAPAPLADVRPAPGHLRILSPASLWQMNSSYFNDAVIQRRLGPPTVTIHPEHAARLGIAAGDPVVLQRNGERLPLAAAVSDIAQPGVGIVHKGRWPGTSPGNANINVLVPARKSDLSGSTTVHGTEVEIVRLEAAE